MRTVESVTIDDARTLVVRFRPGATLTVAPAPAYDSWQFHDAKGLRVVCHPLRFSIW
jgi:hypothetical protein